MSKEALRLALAGLVKATRYGFGEFEEEKSAISSAIQHLEMAEQPAQQESVAVQMFRTPGCSDWYDGVPDQHEAGQHEVRTLYTSPQPAQRKPLTDEQIEQCMKQAYATAQGRNLEHAFARAIESAHGITGESK